MRQFWPCASKLGAKNSMKLYQPSVLQLSNAPVCAGQWQVVPNGERAVTSIDFWSAHFATRTTKTKGRKVKGESESESRGGASQLWAILTGRRICSRARFAS